MKPLALDTLIYKKSAEMIVVTDEMLKAAGRDEQALRLELALWLYARQILSLKKAAQLAGIYWDGFAGIANAENIPVWDAVTPDDLDKQFEQAGLKHL